MNDMTEVKQLRMQEHGLLRAPRNQDGNIFEVCYGVGSPMQISPTEVVVFLNRRNCGIDPKTGELVDVGDFEAGSDAVIFDDLEGFTVDGAFKISHLVIDKHPKTGAPVYLNKMPIFGGFVPLRAKLADGRPHPRAGSGFGLSQVLCLPMDLKKAWAPGTDHHTHLELLQFQYDGKRFEVVRTDRLELDELLAGWSFMEGSLNPAIPDGEDLIMGTWAARKGSGVGVSRWRYGQNGWRPVEFVPASEMDGTMEPSLVRDRDNSLLLCGRWENGKSYAPLRLWRSCDNGVSWKQAIDIPEIRMCAPVTLSTTAGGWPFVASSPRRDVIPMDNLVAPTPCPSWRAVRLTQPFKWRIDLDLWPLTPDRGGIGEPAKAFYAPGGMVDHAIGGVFRLADGRAHSLLFFRTIFDAEQETGCRMGEVFAEEKTEALPWRF